MAYIATSAEATKRTVNYEKGGLGLLIDHCQLILDELPLHHSKI